MHPLAFAAGLDDAGAAQAGEVLGDFGLGLAEGFNQLADADLAIADQAQKLEAGFVGEGQKEARAVEFYFCSHGSIICDLTHVCARDIFKMLHMR